MKQKKIKTLNKQLKEIKDSFIEEKKDIQFKIKN